MISSFYTVIKYIFNIIILQQLREPILIAKIYFDTIVSNTNELMSSLMHQKVAIYKIFLLPPTLPKNIVGANFNINEFFTTSVQWF